MNTSKLPISVDMLLSLATGPLLLGAIAAESLARTLTEVGKASEEVFRGDRLPVLKITRPETIESAENRK